MGKTFALQETTQAEVADEDKVIVVSEPITQEQRFTLRQRLEEKANLQARIAQIDAEVAEVKTKLNLEATAADVIK